ncbi:MAG: DUF2625 family protein [Clostridiales bacterium]|nr:DUF2625 family protein [Clostridiales bacterium]
MKTDALFLELTKRNNISLYKEIDKDTVNQFEEKYSKFQNKFFYEQFTNSGGIIIDNWIRIYGCGDINVVEKNKLYNKDNNMDILIGEDVLGGLFALKDDLIYYFAPDANEWENLNIYYTQFLDWIVNNNQSINKFYELFRWNKWEEDCKKLKLTEGVSFYPLLNFKCNINERSRRIISIDELIRFNMKIFS